MAKSKKHTAGRKESTPSFFSSLSPLTQDILCVGFLYIITLFLFRGIVFQDAAFSSEADTANAVTYAKAGNAIAEKEGVDPIWMPYFFSGMPTFGNVHYVPHDVSYVQKFVVPALKLFYLNSTWGWFCVYYFFCGLFTFLLIRTWQYSRLAALLAAITFMLSPYGIGLAGEGHGSKLMALSYLPLTFLLTHKLFERRDVLSFGLLATAIGTLLLTNHMQIVYYVLIVLGVYLFYHITLDFKERKGIAAAKISLFAGAAFLGLAMSSYIYLSVHEYAQFSIRGGGTAGSTGGLTWDYATNWSWNPWELFTLIIPSFFGFSSGYPYLWQGQMTRLPLYWGTMPFNTSTVYVGIIPILFSVVALIYARNRKVIFIGILTGLVLMMSFGKHFAIFYELLFNILPFFDKFRAPAMIMHLLAFTLAVLGAVGFDFLVDAVERRKELNIEKLRRVLLYIAAGVGAILLLGIVFKSGIYNTLAGFMFEKEGEEYAPQVLGRLKEIRFEVLWNDYVKFTILALASIGTVIAFLMKKIRSEMFGAAMILILLIDLIIMDVKFIHPAPKGDLEKNFQADGTINYLKAQDGLYRIFPLGDLFMENIFPYHGIQSVGGYSPAKLKIYQTLLDSCMYRGTDPSFPINMSIVNMLNTKYLVAKGQLPEGMFNLVNVDQAKRILTYENASALPRAYIVGNVVIAQTDAEVFRILNSPGFDPARTAVLQTTSTVETTQPDSSFAEIKQYASRKIALQTYASHPSILVLSEIYYPAGWKALIDGKETEIFRTNSILRSVLLPAGSHEVEFLFEPETYRTGWLLSNSAWGLTLILVLIGLWREPKVRNLITGKKPE